MIFDALFYRTVLQTDAIQKAGIFIVAVIVSAKLGKIFQILKAGQVARLDAVVEALCPLDVLSQTESDGGSDCPARQQSVQRLRVLICQRTACLPALEYQADD